MLLRLLSAFALLALTGCLGYRVGAVKPEAFSHIRKIAIPTFVNQSQEPRSAVLVTNTVIRQMQTDGTYEISSEERADAVLEATIKQIRRRQARSARFDTLRTSELEFTLEVEFRLRDVKTNATLDSGIVEGTTSQFLDPNLQLSERQALPLAAQRVAENLVSRISEGW
ncbi:MAG: LPS assembly lipoprotein LptE [Verrucomicrobiota bacterium]